MKALVVFGSSRGNTRAVVKKLPALLRFPFDSVDAADLTDTRHFDAYDLLLFLASTWGDGELQVDMEMFFVKCPLHLAGKPYAICELGNYYGYDDFEFGALRIMQHHLNKGGGREFAEPFCMDSLPKRDWEGLARWCEYLNAKVQERLTVE